VHLRIETSRARTVSAVGGASNTSTGVGVALGTVIDVRVDAGIDLVGDVGVVGADVGAAVGTVSTVCTSAG
jgi:hypothetical protein